MKGKTLGVLGLMALIIAPCMLPTMNAASAAGAAGQPLEVWKAVLSYVGTAAFAISGALDASKRQMNIFGGVVLGGVTALGGGTLRDIILSLHPVFWIADANYLSTAGMAAAGAFVVSRYWRLPMSVFVYTDALGVAAFTVIGFRIGFQETQMYTIGVLMGMSTGIAGGMLRDLLSAKTPLIFRSATYALASLCGAMLYALFFLLRVPDALVVAISILGALSICLMPLRQRLSLPVFELQRSAKKHVEVWLTTLAD